MRPLHVPSVGRRRVVQLAVGGALLGARIGAAGAAAPGARTALVLGNAAYGSAPLRNAVSDARLMARTLTELDFRVVLLEDSGFSRMTEALRQWLLGGSDADSRLFYFAGHAVQHQGRNWLLPVDASLKSASELRSAAIDAGELVDRLSRFERGVNVVVLDACRTWPESLVAPGPRSRSVGGSPRQGLAPVEAPRGTLVAYSTAPGSVALDGSGAHSPYTRHLAEQMRVPGLPLENVFKRVRAAVLQESGQTQVPWETSSLIGEYCLRPDSEGRCAPPSVPAPGRLSIDPRKS
jgi:uncharacterized caspase-like protein